MASQVDTLITALTAALPVAWTQASGSENVEQHDAPPRVVWVRPERQDAWAPVGKAGGRNTTARALWTRTVSLEARLWATDYSELETPATGMIDRVVQAIHAETVGCYRIESGAGYVSESNVLEYGVAYVIPFSVDVPVLRATPTTGTIDHVEAQMQSDVGGTVENGPLIEVP